MNNQTKPPTKPKYETPEKPAVRNSTPSDPCFSCRLPVSQCKGKCTPAERRANGGQL